MSPLLPARLRIALRLAALAAVPVTTLGQSAPIPPASAAAAAGILRHPEVTAQQPLTIHYETHKREAFWIRGATYELRFRLAPPGIGVDILRPAGTPGSLVSESSLDIGLTRHDGDRFATSLAASPARINIFRHGPHYADVHIFDLHPTTAKGDTLPVRVEVILHAYPERLYVETVLHPTVPATELPLLRDVTWVLPLANVTRYLGEGAWSDGAVGETFRRDRPEAGYTLGAETAGGAALGLVLADPAGTAALQLSEAGDRSILQLILDPAFENHRGKSASYVRLVAGDAAAVAAARQEELNLLPAEAVIVGDGATWEGYDPRRGFYTLSTETGLDVNRHFEHPDHRGVAAFGITNDAFRRRILIRHRDAAGGDRLGAGVVTDVHGHPLPILVQSSKNFSGEHEEPFYDPGDPAYSESFFPVVLDPGERALLRSVHLYQNWGRFPIKGLSSLQAWMPYYQMSVGVTETTCYVPFRFGGHPGIWIADLRGLSGRMWTTQPQFDNVGGHRFFHYTRHGVDHFPRVVRSRFRMTGPNLVWWGMEYETDDGAARLLLEMMEMPQTDETRHFVNVRVDFQDELTLRGPKDILHLLSIDTRTQRLRYGKAGYLNASDQPAEVDLRGDEPLMHPAVLSRTFPVAGLYDNLPESGQEGNNAVLVRRFVGQADGRPLVDLAVRIDTLGGGDVRLSLTLPDSVVSFRKGDFLDLELMLLPHGVHGSDFSTPLRERERYGINAPSVVVRSGRLVSSFPPAVRMAEEGPTEFTVVGGFGVIPVLVEGAYAHVPPRLQRRGRLGWQPVEMSTDGSNGHQTYLTDDGRFGFVFLVETDGSAVPFRILR